MPLIAQYCCFLGVVVCSLVGTLVPSYAQLEIKGQVLDEQDQGLEWVNVLLTDSSNQVIGYTHTNAQGYFTLVVNDKGSFVLGLSCIGFRNLQLPIAVNTNPTQLKGLILIEEQLELQEVVIQSAPAIIVKKDTVVMDVAAFATGHEQVVEDLLNKIPGLSVKEDGSIMVGQKKVERVLIEGDNFFDEGYQLLTKNMPADPIGQVEILENFSENALLKGVEHTGKIALNLKLKEEAKRNWFAQVKAAVGPPANYDATANVFNVGLKNKYYFLTNANNVGLDPSGNYLENQQSFEWLDQQGLSYKTTPLIEIKPDPMRLENRRVHFNNDQLLSVNGIFNPSDVLKIKSFLNLENKTKQYKKEVVEQYRIGVDSFVTTKSEYWYHNQAQWSGKVELEYTMGTTGSLSSKSYWLFANGSTENLLEFNAVPSDENLTQQHLRANQQLLFTKRLDPQKALEIKAHYLYDKRPQKYGYGDFLFDALFPEVTGASSIQQSADHRIESMVVEARFLNKFEQGNNLELTVGTAHKKEYFFNHFSIWNDTVQLASPLAFQNQMEQRANNSYLNLKYRLNWKKVQIRATGKLNQLNKELLSENSENQTTNPFYGTGQLSFNWKANQRNQLLLNWSRNWNNLTAMEVHPQWALTSFQSFKKGHSPMDELVSNVGMLHYKWGNWTDDFVLNAFLMHTIHQNYITYNSLITPDFALDQAELVDNRYTLFFEISTEYFLRPLSSNLKAKVSNQAMHYRNTVNGMARKVEIQYLQLDVSWRTAFIGPFNMHAGANWKKNTIQTTSENSFLDQQYFADFYQKIGQKLQLEVKMEWYKFGGTLQNTIDLFADARCQYALRENKIKIGLKINNILNQTEMVNRFNSDVSSKLSRYQLNPRMVLIQVDFRL